MFLKNKKYLFHIIATLLNFQLCGAESATQTEYPMLIFDIMNVLFHRNELQTDNVLKWDIARFAWRKGLRHAGHVKEFASRIRFHGYLNARRHQATRTVPLNTTLYDDANQLIADDVCDWIKGIISVDQLAQKVGADPVPAGYDQADKDFVKAILEKTMAPKAFASLLYPAKGIRELLLECKRRQHRLCVVANFDQQAYTEIAQSHQDIMQLFDHRIIAGEVHITSDNQQFYKFLPSAPSYVYVGFDQRVLSIAKQWGIQYCIHHKSVQQTHKELTQYGLFDQKPAICSSHDT